MKIEFKEMPPIGTNAFALIEPACNECVIVDAPLDSFSWAEQIARENNCSIAALILTHGHWDHILDGHKFANAGITIYGHIADKKLFEQPAEMTNYAIPGVELLPVPIDNWLQDDSTINLLDDVFEIRHVPGHCPGNVLIYLASQGWVLVGDAIFAGSIGRYDLPGGDFSVLEKSIRTQIYTLPDETTIYPGHGVSTTVAQEKRSNPFVRP